MAKNSAVPRPTKASEYSLRFATRQAARGWQDLQATIRGPLADTWDFLTRTPLSVQPTNYPLKGSLATVKRNGHTYDRWQHKPTRRGDARIWFYVDEATVYIEQVHTAHPHETK